MDVPLAESKQKTATFNPVAATVKRYLEVRRLSKRYCEKMMEIIRDLYSRVIAVAPKVYAQADYRLSRHL